MAGVRIITHKHLREACLMLPHCQSRHARGPHAVAGLFITYSVALYRESSELLDALREWAYELRWE
jgi:hypothetical protein